MEKQELNDLMTAINRERLVLEEKIKENKELDKELKSLKSEKEKLNDEVDSLKVKSKEINAKYQDLLIYTQNSINEKQSELDTIIKSIKLSNEQRDLEQVKWLDNIALIRENYNKESERLNEELKSIKNEIANKLDEKSKLESAILILNGDCDYVKKNIDSENKNLIKIKNEQTKILVERDSVLTEIENEKNELKKIKDTNAKTKSKGEEIDIEIKSKQIELDKLNTEIDSINQAKKEINIERFRLQQDKEAFANKEQFIRDKYDQAGIKFN